MIVYEPIDKEDLKICPVPKDWIYAEGIGHLKPINTAQNNTPVKDDWISVGDRLPEVEEDILLYMAKQGNLNKPCGEYIGWLNPDNKTYTIRLGKRLDTDAEANPDFWFVTHWQPLPSPPTNLISKPLK